MYISDKCFFGSWHVKSDSRCCLLLGFWLWLWLWLWLSLRLSWTFNLKHWSILRHRLHPQQVNRVQRRVWDEGSR